MIYGTARINGFCDYFKGRRQHVVIDGVCSEYFEVNCGVPQGRKVEPILFVLYVNVLNLPQQLMLS